MKQMIKMVLVVLLAVFIASCETAGPYEGLTETTTEVKVSMDVRSAADSSRITYGNIEFDGGRYTNKVMTTNGILDDSLEVQLEPVSAFAYAEGYQPADTVQIDLTQDVNRTFYLTEKEGEPDPDGSGNIDVNDPECIADKAIGSVFGTVENGFVTIKLLDADSREVISEKEGLSPTDDQEFEFSDVPNGTYIVVASRDNGSEPSESKPVTVDCEVQEGPGQIDVTASSCSDPDQANGLLTITIENGADTLITTRNGDIVDERYDVAAGEEVELIELTAGDYEITAVKNGKPTEVTETIDTCEVKEGPGKIDIKTNSCSEPDQPTGVLAFTVENGADSLRVDRDEEMVAELSDIAPGERIELTEVAAGDYDITAFLNDKQTQENETVTTCDQPDPNQAPTAKLNITTNGLTASYDASGSSDSDGDIVEYRWDFDNDEEIDEVTDVPTNQFTFSEGGNYTGRVVAVDDDGATDEATDSFTVEKANKAPTAKLNITTNGLTASYDASGSSDSDGDIVEYRWDFDNDEEIDEVTDVPTNQFTFSEGGNYTGRVVAVDDDGATDEATDSFTVEEPEGPGTIDKVGRTCSADCDGTLTVRVQNGFSSISIKQNETVVQHFDELTVEDDQEFTFTGLEAGTYTVVPELNSETREKVLTVKKCKDPIARFSSEANGFTVDYDASGSSTENGEIEQYEWDWKDDGTIDEVTTSPQPSFEFDEEGPFTTRLRITDSRGLTSETTGEVHPFQPNRDPNVDFDAETDGLTVYLENLSNDPDGQNLTCEWTYGDGNSSDQFDPGSYEYSNSGTYDITLYCEDPDGASDSKTKTITVEVILSEEYTHRISIFADQKVWVSAHKDRLEDKLMDFGGAKPIMTEKDPFGTVRMKVKLKSDVNGHSFMRIFFNEDGSDYIQTPILDAESSVDGWTTVTVEMDAEEFAGRARDLAGFRVIHGDAINDTKPEGPDSVYFAKADVDGEVTFYWRVVLDNSQNAKMMNTNEDNYKFESSHILK